MVIWFNGGEFSSLKDGKESNIRLENFFTFVFFLSVFPKVKKRRVQNLLMLLN